MILRYFGILFIAVLLAQFTPLCPPEAFCSDMERPKKGPVNPAFLEYQKKMGQAKALGTQTTSGFGMGEIPDPIPPEIHKPDKVNRSQTYEVPSAPQDQPTSPDRGALPSDEKYDMRDPNNDDNFSDTLLTPVRDQGLCNTCWAFTTYGVLESFLKWSFDLSDSVNDYSEDNLRHRHGFDWKPDDGGNMKMSTAYLARHDGPISESDDPYTCGSTDFCSDCTPVRHVDNAVFMPVRSGVTDNVYIKEAIVQHGALYTSIYYHDSFYNNSDHTYYYDGPNDSNHGVVIVGWDDNKGTAADEDGAFIVRNHWGTSWGESGYFYVSYYDKSIAFKQINYFIDEDDSQLDFDTIFQYDRLGWTGSIGYGDGSDWGANIFIPRENGEIVAVGFYAVASNMSYEIDIYDDFNGTTFSNSLLGKAQPGSVEYSGYYTVKLDTPVAVSRNDNFAVVVKFNIPGEPYPIPTEGPISGYASTTAGSGESYISPDGVTFSDIVGSPGCSSTNVCIKAFSKMINRNAMPWLLLLLGD
jgi:C1A family cysteine protease